MNPILKAGTRIVILALLAYTAGIFCEQRKKRATNNVLLFLSIGVLLDVIATALMIIGSTNQPFTVHGILGYSALAAMMIDTVLMGRLRLAYGAQKQVPGRLHLYSRLAYSWWLVAFITGGLLAALK